MAELQVAVESTQPSPALGGQLASTSASGPKLKAAAETGAVQKFLRFAVVCCQRKSALASAAIVEVVVMK